MSLVFAAIAPHGGLAVAEACAPDELELAARTRAGFEELGRRCARAAVETAVVLTPHNVHVEGSFAVVEAGRLEGSLKGTPVELAAAIDLELAGAVKASLREAGLPAVGVSYGGNNAREAVMPMDWAVLIPLWFLGGRVEPAPRVVVVAPARELDAQAHRSAGRALSAAAEASPARVAVIASADHGHGHRDSGPYGFRPDSATYDRRVLELISEDRLAELAAFDRSFVDAAAADSWWQLLMLEGALGSARWRSEVRSYEAPTYFGMLTASYEREG